MSLPDSASVTEQLAAFDADLAAARSPRDAQAVRDRFLGRKNSVVATWMQLIAGAPPDQKKLIGRYANELKQHIEARWATYQDAAAAGARPAGAVDVTLPGRTPFYETAYLAFRAGWTDVAARAMPEGADRRGLRRQHARYRQRLMRALDRMSASA